MFLRWECAETALMPHFEARHWPTSACFRFLSILRPIGRRRGAILRLASHHRLTLYDAAYLELAVRRVLPLATLDKELRTAAEAEGVPLLGV